MRRPLPLLAAAAVPVLALAGLEFGFFKGIAPGVTAAGVPVGGLSVAEATERVAGSPVLTRAVTVRVGERSVSLPAAELGWRPDPGETVARAYKVGREGDPLARLSERWRTWREGRAVPLVARVDEAALRSRLAALGKPLEAAASDAKLVLVEGGYVVRRDRPGRRADVDAAARAFLADPGLASLELPARAVPAAVMAASLTQLAAEANARLRPLSLVYAANGKSWRTTLTRTQVADLFFVRRSGLTPDPTAARRVLARLARKHDRLGRDATYAAVGERLTIVPEVAGWRLDLEAAVPLLEAAVLEAGQGTVTLPVVAQEAAVRAADLPDPEKLALLAEATTSYKGSSVARSTNIAVAAGRLDRHVVAPGETFSFNAAIGAIAASTGYRSALVISNGETVDGIGGGVCQVSTTAFRALYKTGLPIVERSPHSFIVEWYGPTIGFDAAVYQPTLDLKMKNDTAGPLLVRSGVDARLGRVTVRVYGLPAAKRQVAVSSPVFLERGARTRTRITRTVADAAGARTDTLFSSYRPGG